MWDRSDNIRSALTFSNFHVIAIPPVSHQLGVVGRGGGFNLFVITYNHAVYFQRTYVYTVGKSSMGIWGLIPFWQQCYLFSFYHTKQFSPRFKSPLAFLKYNMIISLRSICILNANCDVSISVLSLRTAKGPISLYICFPRYGWILHFPSCQSSLTLCLTSFLPSSVYSTIFVSLHIFQLPFSLSPPRSPPTHPLCRPHLCVALIDIAVCFRSRVNEECALGRGVDHLSAFILVEVSHSWLTWPAEWNHTLSSAACDLFPRNV